MIKFLLLFLLPFSLYASKILSYNIYERTDRADVMITFDTPYNGLIKQSNSSSQIVIKLDDAMIESSKMKNISSNFLHSLAIIPMKGYTKITASVSSSARLIASKTSDSYGLRLRFTNKKTLQNLKSKKVENQTNLSALPTKKETEISSNYYAVVGMLLLAIVLLLIMQKKIQKKTNKGTTNFWLFKTKNQASSSENIPEIKPNNEVSIRFQKIINDENSVVMLDFGNQSYLVLMGKSNILLDKFTDSKPQDQEEFEKILQNRHQELEDFLGSDSTNSIEEVKKEPLQAYKEKAASLIYSDSEN